jgi:hypothetical protein
MDAVEETTDVKRNYPGSVFAAATMNFGPQVRCCKHLDSQNLAFGWCAITAFGDFDPTKGGHLILWDLKLAVEFPPGSTILIPSATVVHSNTPVQGHEKRLSFTQYSAGGMFRWVDNGLQTEHELQHSDKERHDLILILKEHRWNMGLGMYSNLDELLESVG